MAADELKDKFTQEQQFSHIFSHLCWLERRVSLRSPQNISGTSQQNRVAVFS